MFYVLLEAGLLFSLCYQFPLAYFSVFVPLSVIAWDTVFAVVVHT